MALWHGSRSPAASHVHGVVALNAAEPSHYSPAYPIWSKSGRERESA